ncbi:MAG: Exodeoxyribonuclease 7 large subunit [Chlamydiae bacterium]|nr:Exodeoxyribonuclease 7 large subunit [Chlamydiota bacterium]
MSAPSKDIPVLTVTQLTNAIKHKLETTFPSIWLQGEISNSKLHSSGHFYFSLKDPHAQISAVMFRGSASTLKSVPKDGDNVVVYGNLNVYPPSGKYQIVVQELRFAGLGELLLKLEELKKKLHKRGWFSKEHKKPIPKLPRKIGVVTSPTGAAIQDILNILSRRFAGFHLVLNPVRVQGEGAAEEICTAIQQFNEYKLVDVIIIGRGGGSIEDLWAFNEEIVAEAIFHSQIPIIAAVGHETDHCIAEYVADVRAPTPSAAAELVIAEKSQQIQLLTQMQTRFQQTTQQIIRQHKNRLESIINQPSFRSPYTILGPWMQKLDDTRQALDSTILQFCKQKRLIIEARQKILQSLQPTTQITHFKHKLQSFSKQLNNTFTRNMLLRRERLKHTISSLKAIDPKNLLTKGYSILFSEKDRSIITSVRKLEKNQKLRMLVSDGEILSTIEEIFSHERK